MNKDELNNNLTDNVVSNNLTDHEVSNDFADDEAINNQDDGPGDVETENPSANSDQDTKEQQKQKNNNNMVAILVGRWAMPTTVLLVLITCMSGYFLSESAFTPVVGMIAPVVMALIMVIKEASVGKDEDPMLVDRRQERKERLAKSEHQLQVEINKIQSTERLKKEEMKEQAHQFDAREKSRKEFIDLIKEMNDKLTESMNKEKSTELIIGDTKIKIGDGGTVVESKETPDVKKEIEKVTE